MNCIIIDDEPLALEVILAHCKHYPELQVVATCSNAVEAFEALHKHTVQLIFLDINMPIINGLTFLRSLKEPPAVILTTAYTEYAVESYELDVIDYLLKPISLDRFDLAIQKLKSRSSIPNIIPVNTAPPSNYNINTNTKDFLFVKENGKLIKINFKDIFYIEGLKDYLKIITTEKVYVVHQTMKSMEETLPAHLFMRVHKSFIVSLSAIKQIDGNYIETAKGGVPLSKTYKDALLAHMQ